MCGSSGSQVTSSSGPPSQFLQAYSDVYNRAQGVAGQPLQQFPAGPNASNIVAPLQPNQNSAISTISNLQGAYQPTLDAAQSYLKNGTGQITPLQFNGVNNLPSQGLNSIGQAQNEAYSIPGDVQPFLATSQMGAPGNYAGNLATYMSPYTQNVTSALQNLFDEQNAEQLSQVKGNAIAQNAYGGDREAIAEAETARNQQLAQAPVLAQALQSGYAQAASTLGQQQQLGLAGGQLAEGADLAGGQLNLAAGQGLLGEFNTQQQTGVGAQQANDWINQGAGYGLANLAQLGQNLGLSGASAQLQAGGLQQGQAQQVLNVPYEQFIQQQAYPFQTTGWLANIAEGLGGSSGGTASTTYPGPSAISQIGGLGLAGAGVLGATGGFGSNGYISNLFNGTPANVASDGIANPLGNTLANLPGGGLDSLGYPLQADGGRVRGRADGGGLTVPYDRHYAPGGLVPDLSLSIIPGASGMGTAPPPGGGGGLHSAFMQPVTTQTQSGGGGGGVLGPLGTIVGFATGLPFLGAVGSAVDKATGFADGGGADNQNRGLAAPLDVSKSYVPTLTQQTSGRMGPPSAPSMPQQQNPINQSMSLVNGLQSVSKLFSDDNNKASGGYVEPSSTPLQYDGGGMVPPMQSSQSASNPAQAQQREAQMLQEYSQMPIEQLQELAVRYPATTPQGAAVQRALQQRKMSNSANYPGNANPGPNSGVVTGGTSAARGGAMGLEHFADGGEFDIASADDLARKLTPLDPSAHVDTADPSVGGMYNGRFFQNLIDKQHRAGSSLGVPPILPGIQHFDTGGDVIATSDFPVAVADIPPRALAAAGLDAVINAGAADRHDNADMVPTKSELAGLAAPVDTRRGTLTVMPSDASPPASVSLPLQSPSSDMVTVKDSAGTYRVPRADFDQAKTAGNPYPGQAIGLAASPDTPSAPAPVSGGLDASDQGAAAPWFAPNAPRSFTTAGQQNVQEAIAAARGRKATDAAIAGVIANGLGEGGFNTTWQKAWGDENSFGHWQFNDRGEMPGYLSYLKANGLPNDTRSQTNYVFDRMEQIYPGFSQIKDPKKATDLVGTLFERYQGAAPGQRYGLLDNAQKIMSGDYSVSLGPTGGGSRGGQDTVLRAGGAGVPGFTRASYGGDNANSGTTSASPGTSFSPEIMKILTSLSKGRDGEDTGSGIYKSPWLPLIAIGAGMLASRSPHAGVALGEGLQTGLGVLGQQQKAGPENELKQAQADVARLQLGLLPAKMQAGIDTANAFASGSPSAASSAGAAPVGGISGSGGAGAATLAGGAASLNPMAAANSAMGQVLSLSSSGANPTQLAQAALGTANNLPLPSPAPANDPVLAEYDRNYAAIKQGIRSVAPFEPEKLPAMMESYQKLFMSDPRNQALAERMKAEARIVPEIITAGGKANAELPAKKEFAEYETGQHLKEAKGKMDYEPQEYVVPAPNNSGSMTLVAPRSQVMDGTAPGGAKNPLTIDKFIPQGPPATEGGKYDPSPESLIAVAPPAGVTAAKPIDLSKSASGKLEEDNKTLEMYRKTAAEVPLQMARINELSKMLDATKTGRAAEAGYNMAAWAKSVGLGGLIPEGYDPSNIEQINKLATQLVFSQIKQIGGRALVSEIEGLGRANPNVALTPEANRAILQNVALEQGLAQDRYINASKVFSRYKQLGNFDENYIAKTPAGQIEQGIRQQLAPVAQQQQTQQRAALPAGYPEQAKQAPNGRWYVPVDGGWAPIIPNQPAH